MDTGFLPEGNAEKMLVLEYVKDKAKKKMRFSQEILEMCSLNF